MLQQSSALEILQTNDRKNSDSLIDFEKLIGLLNNDKLFLQSEVRNLETKYDEKAKENEGNVSKKLELESKVRTNVLSIFNLNFLKYSSFLLHN